MKKKLWGFYDSLHNLLGQRSTERRPILKLRDAVRLHKRTRHHSNLSLGSLSFAFLHPHDLAWQPLRVRLAATLQPVFTESDALHAVALRAT